MNEAELLFSDVLQCNRLGLYLNGSQRLDKTSARAISQALRRRINGESIYYILGKIEFMGLEFAVNPNVLVPRADTEVLVETALKYIRKLPAANVLDIGTGSGCIAISLAKLSQAKVAATDISEQALMVARQNAALHKLAPGVDFIRCDLFPQSGIYDIIVSNPPYVRSKDISFLDREVQAEPVCALDGGKDGLDYYRRITQDAPGYLSPQGLLIFEVGFAQSLDVQRIINATSLLQVKEVVKDYDSIERVIVAQLK